MLMALSFGVYITFAGDGNVSEVTAASGGITVSYCKSKKEGEGKLKSSRCLSEERFDRKPRKTVHFYSFECVKWKSEHGFRLGSFPSSNEMS